MFGSSELMVGSSFDGEKLWKETEDLRVVGRWEKVLLQWRRIRFEQEEEGAIVAPFQSQLCSVSSS